MPIFNFVVIFFLLYVYMQSVYVCMHVYVRGQL